MGWKCLKLWDVPNCDFRVSMEEQRARQQAEGGGEQVSLSEAWIECECFDDFCIL